MALSRFGPLSHSSSVDGGQNTRLTPDRAEGATL
jgi:hypothetical protein